jgi:hypothetical protein
MALDRSKTYFHFTVISVCANVTAFVIGLHWGIVGVAACFAISMIILQPFYTRLAARALDSSLSEFLLNLRGVAVATILMSAGVWGVDRALGPHEIAPVLRLAALTGVGAITYLLALRLVAVDVYRDVRAVARRFRPAGSGRGQDCPAE